MKTFQPFIPLLIMVLAMISVQAQTEQNVAYGKTATQSSTYPGGDASHAVDGITNGNWGGRSVTHTQLEEYPHLLINLGKEHRISRIEIWPRTDCCQERLSDLSITYVNPETFKVLPFSSSRYTHPGGNEPLVIYGNASTGTIRITKNSPGYLSVAEVKVFGVSLVEPQDVNFLVINQSDWKLTVIPCYEKSNGYSKEVAPGTSPNLTFPDYVYLRGKMTGLKFTWKDGLEEKNLLQSLQYHEGECWRATGKVLEFNGIKLQRCN